MPERLIIKKVAQYAADHTGNTLPIYVENIPRDANGNIPKGFTATMICPECSQGKLVKGGAVGSGNSIMYTCDYEHCGFEWRKKDRMMNGIALETL